ncbi:GerAB/ArcD/ProY family transporter [Senegalia massiliensis]|uniref:Spore germination protein n=1 Tax=Senegalia massiliensis TaxID=1720316 RepID=A0A845QXT5_9CLOT|nr:endospore germination permease [Senegalia massiliensis]NBI05962.1 hypothetical protein [Senegalia massiliensis]
MTKTIINNNQLRNFIFLQYVATSVVLFPSMLSSIAKQDAWLSALLGSMLSIILALIYYNLIDKMGEKNLIEYIEYLFGKYIGNLIKLLFIFFLILACSTQIWIMGNFLSTHIMHDTPPYVLKTLFMIVVIIAAKLGLEVVARSSEIIIPIILIGFFIPNILLIPQIDINNMYPILEKGFNPVFKGILPFMGSTSFTFIALLMFCPSNVNNVKGIKKDFLISTIIASIVLIIAIDMCTLVLGAEITSRHLYPTHILSKKAKVGEYIQRLEILFAMVWFLSVFYKLFIYFYGLTLSVSQFLKLNDYKILILPIAMIMIILSTIVYPDTIYSIEWDNPNWINLSLTFGLILPLILLFTQKIKGK